MLPRWLTIAWQIFRPAVPVRVPSWPPCCASRPPGWPNWPAGCVRTCLNRAVDRLSLNIPPEETLARVRQEISLLSLKDDITEELDRLDTHLEAMDQALAAGGPVGKRLDFLSQELNREANTIASKSIALSITDTALALKLHIEQVREQVQNLE